MLCSAIMMNQENSSTACWFFLVNLPCLTHQKETKTWLFYHVVSIFSHPIPSMGQIVIQTSPVLLLLQLERQLPKNSQLQPPDSLHTWRQLQESGGSVFVCVFVAANLTSSWKTTETKGQHNNQTVQFETSVMEFLTAATQTTLVPLGISAAW